ncbi:hypothetical protein, partial [Iodobacter sp. BJB302]|uniref:hypothetical protein n=1 Tax=Iodobacter sp. BJB302 TaxID=1506510 RepID=UPI001C5588BF
SSQIFESNLPNVQLCSPYFMINEKKKLSINYPSFDYKVNSIGSAQENHYQPNADGVRCRGRESFSCKSPCLLDQS